MIFRQTRVGQNGETFDLFKFKTIDEEGRVARPFLRHTGLDELPQIVNIVRGDMALFGPRPEVPDLDSVYFEQIPEWRARHDVKPGLLCLAQVYGVVRGPDRFTIEAKKKQAELDARWISARRLGKIVLGLYILALLPFAVVRGQRA